MTTSINNTYINALLADATYVHGLSSEFNLTQKLSLRMTPILAKYINDNFSVVTQIQSGDNILTGDSGFDATVWRQTSTSKLFVSMRGTEPGADLAIADLDLAFNANARLQLRDMVNWWFRETGEAGQSVRQIGIEATLSPNLIPPFIPPLIPALTFSEAGSTVGTGRITAADLVKGV